jgi:putative membrane protein
MPAGICLALVLAQEVHMKRMVFTVGLTCALALPAMAAAQATSKPATPAEGKGQEKSKAGAPASPDRTFVMEAARGGLAEVEMGRMADSKAVHPDVKQFGQRMVDDHGKANEELKALASQKQWTLPTEPGPKHKPVHDRLMKLSGEEFDRAYMAAMVADHDKDVAAFERAARMVKDAELKAWAAKTVPTLKEHQKMAHDVNGKVRTPPAKPKK